MRLAWFLLSLSLQLSCTVTSTSSTLNKNPLPEKCSGEDESGSPDAAALYPKTCHLLQMPKSEVTMQLNHLGRSVGTAVSRIERQDLKSSYYYEMNSPEWSSSRTEVSEQRQMQQLQEEYVTSRRVYTNRSNHTSSIPVVTAHGLGDSCFKAGFSDFTQKVGTFLDTYAVCIPTGETEEEDVYNSYFLNMDASVEIFAQLILEDPHLTDGFHAIGVSQGNTLIRGYIIKYGNKPDYPRVYTYMSISGVNAGVGAFPYCAPNEDTGEFTDVCASIQEFCTGAAYTSFFQQNIYPANYWRDPNATETDEYKTFSQLAQWGNEGYNYNQTYFDNFLTAELYVWVLSEFDRVVWPNEGEQWGGMTSDSPYQDPVPMEEMEWYISDLFGLKSADKLSMHNFESFNGTHTGWSDNDLYRWLDKYFTYV